MFVLEFRFFFFFFFGGGGCLNVLLFLFDFLAGEGGAGVVVLNFGCLGFLFEREVEMLEAWGPNEYAATPGATSCSRTPRPPPPPKKKKK